MQKWNLLKKTAPCILSLAGGCNGEIITLISVPRAIWKFGVGENILNNHLTVSYSFNTRSPFTISHQKHSPSQFATTSLD